MFNTNLKMALRHLLKHPLFTCIKLTGLTLGILGCLLIGMYLHYELTYDNCHEHADRIVFTTMELRAGGEVIHVGSTGNMVAPVLKMEFPEIESAVRVIKYDNIPMRLDDQVYEENAFYYADSTFFDIFTFPMRSGDAGRALTEPYQLVLTASAAKKIFGDTDPTGRTLHVRDQEFQVSGVMADPPANTQLKPRFIASFVSLRDAAPERATWWNANYSTYFLLHDRKGRQQLESKIGPFMRSRANETRMTGDDYLTYHFEPLRDVHLHSQVQGNFEPKGDIRYIYLLATVGLLILFIGITTYVNLTAAENISRAKEIGVQKVLGAGNTVLLKQHLGAAATLTGIAFAVGLGLLFVVLPSFNRIFDRSLEAGVLFNPLWIGGLLVVLLLISLLAGGYPAWVAAKFSPIVALHSGKDASKGRPGGDWLRKSLIVFQFAISAFLLLSTLVIQGQMRFIKNKNLGYDSEHVLALPSDSKIVSNLAALKTEFTKSALIQSVSLAYDTPASIEGGYSISKSVTGEDSKPVIALPADEDIVRTIGLELAAGSSFTRQDVDAVQRMYNGDTTVVRTILLNEQQVSAFGWTPTEAVNRQVNFNGKPALVKGVVQDFHFTSLHEPVGKLVIFPDTWGNVVLVRISGTDIPGALTFLEQQWRALVSHRPFSYHFIDEEFDAMYGSEIRSSLLVTVGCGLAIFLACLGLLGLATYSITQRIREIGIRKVLGASASGIVALLTKDFLKLVVAGIVVSFPLAYIIMNKWLQDFAYRIDIAWWMFAVAAIVPVVVAFFTVSFHSIKAALTNPVRVMRSE